MKYILGKPRAQEQGLHACRLSVVSMPAEIAWGISLCFDNLAAHPVSPHLAYDGLPG
jgi:hypothetical protein